MADKDPHSPATREAAAAALPPAGPVVHSGESQWALVWREFCKRRLALVSLGVIVLLITVSIAAPFLANNQPLYYRGYNRFEYQEAQRTLLAVMNTFADVRPKPPPKSGSASKTSAAKSSTASKDSSKDAKANEPPKKKGDAPAVVIARQFDLMQERLQPDSAAELRTLREQVMPLIEKASQQSPPSAETAAEIRKLRREISNRFKGNEVPLATRSHWPVFASLDWGDAAFVVFNVSLLLIPAWLPLVRLVFPPEAGGARTLSVFAMLVVLPLACGGIWKLTIPERLDRTRYKDAVEAGGDNAAKAPVVYEKVVWPPIRYALDEQDLDRKYVRPALSRYLPDWTLGIWTELPEGGGDDANAQTRYSGPNWLGTDGTGRDVLSRMIWGGRVSLSVGIVATAIEIALGVLFGALAGYFRGWVDILLSRLIEIVICFPSFFLILTIVAFLGPSIYNIMIVIGITGWTGLARLVRGDFLKLADQEFVLSAKALGYTPLRIIFRHILPNAMAPVLVTATFAIAGAILIESGLSFLGLGITVPKPSWGGILSTGRDSLFRAPWIIFFPGLALFVTITAYNLVGEAFRDASDPRMRGRV